jgi:hypothetical protein
MKIFNENLKKKLYEKFKFKIIKKNKILKKKSKKLKSLKYLNMFLYFVNF